MPKAKTATTSPTDIPSLLLWCRANGFAVSEIEAGGVKLSLVDTRAGAAETQPKTPRTVHEAWAQQFGIGSPDDEDEEQPS